jgi:uncharacterized protein YjbI with pentapeptide repeats
VTGLKRSLAAFALGTGFGLVVRQGKGRARQHGSWPPHLRPALELLGSVRAGPDGRPAPNLEARLGAIAVLTRIAQSSASDCSLVIQILSAYVRANAGWMDGNPPTRAAALMPDDIQSALDFLTDRSVRARSAVELNLTRTDLRGARLWGRDLSGAILARCYLDRSDLGEAELQGAVLWGSSLQGAILFAANLRGAQLWNANLSGAVFTECDLTGADLRHAALKGAVFTNAKLDGAAFEGASGQVPNRESIAGPPRPTAGATSGDG